MIPVQATQLFNILGLIGNRETERVISLLHVLITHRTEHLYKEVLNKICELIPTVELHLQWETLKRHLKMHSIKLSPLSTLVHAHPISSMLMEKNPETWIIKSLLAK